MRGLCPIGSVVSWIKSFTGVPALATQGRSEWVEVNGAVISDVESPLNGQTLPNLNGSSDATAKFLRGYSSSGGSSGAASHSHTVTHGHSDTFTVASGTACIQSESANIGTDYANIGTDYASISTEYASIQSDYANISSYSQCYDTNYDGCYSIAICSLSVDGHGHSDSGHSHSDSGHCHTDSGHSHSDSGHTHNDSGHTHSINGSVSSAAACSSTTSNIPPVYNVVYIVRIK